MGERLIRAGSLQGYTCFVWIWYRFCSETPGKADFPYPFMCSHDRAHNHGIDLYYSIYGWRGLIPGSDQWYQCQSPKANSNHRHLSNRWSSSGERNKSRGSKPPSVNRQCDQVLWLWDWIAAANPNCSDVFKTGVLSGDSGGWRHRNHRNLPVASSFCDPKGRMSAFSL